MDRSTAANTQQQYAPDLPRLNKQGRHHEQVPDTAGKQALRVVVTVKYAIGVQTPGPAGGSYLIISASDVF